MDIGRCFTGEFAFLLWILYILLVALIIAIIYRIMWKRQKAKSKRK